MHYSKKMALGIILILFLGSGALSSGFFGQHKLGVLTGISLLPDSDNPLANYFVTGLHIGGSFRVSPIFYTDNWFELRLNAAYQYYIPGANALIDINTIPGGDNIRVKAKPSHIFSLAADTYWFVNGNDKHNLRPYVQLGIGALTESKLVLKSENPRLDNSGRSYDIRGLMNLGFGTDVYFDKRTVFRVNLGLALIMGPTERTVFYPFTVTYLIP